MVDLFRYRHWDLVSHRGIYYIISGLMLTIGLVALFLYGLNFGIDFKGGGLITYRVDGRLPAAQHAAIIHDIRTSLDEAGVKGNEVQVSPAAVASSGDQILIRTPLAKDKGADLDAMLVKEMNEKITPTVTSVLAKDAPNVGAPVLEGQEVVTGTVSTELINNGIAALVLGSALIMLWIGIRYNIGGFGFRYSVAGILALLHDLLTLIGMFAIFHNVLQVNSPFIAALLTVLGYSIHDTIVIFDRIRENMRLRKGRTFAETVNISLLETMARSVNTILTVLFTLLALFFFGGPTLRDFVAAMLIGVVVGGYSSIFIASQLLVSWSKGKDRVILPANEPTPAAVAVPQPAMAAVASAPAAPVQSIAAPRPTVDRTAIQEARKAGKTAKRKR